MGKRTNDLTPLELEIMNVLWQGGPMTVQAVHQQIQPQRALAYNSVQTVLTILHRKGKVKRVTDKRAYIYTPAVSQEKTAAQAVKNLIDRLFGGQAETLVLNMVKNRQISASQLAELQKMIDEEPGDGKS
jgi:predicted transcriptional regulator